VTKLHVAISVQIQDALYFPVHSVSGGVQLRAQAMWSGKSRTFLVSIKPSRSSRGRRVASDEWAPSRKKNSTMDIGFELESRQDGVRQVDLTTPSVPSSADQRHVGRQGSSTHLGLFEFAVGKAFTVLFMGGSFNRVGGRMPRRPSCLRAESNGHRNPR
jgi:hypothetical protein